MWTFPRLLAIAVAIAAIGFGGRPAPAADKLVVVELFTSQGCSSCPPADRLMAKLARRDGILALSFHVDYWDDIGWKDPYSIAAATKRQKSYRRAFNKRFVYTPQIVIDGRFEVSGARLSSVPAKLESARARPKIDVLVDRLGDGMAEVRIAAGEKSEPPADVWVVLFDREHITRVASGENKGRSLTSTNVVRSFQRLGVWRGSALTFTLPLMALGGKGRDSCAIIVQKPGPGPIIGAAAIRLGTKG
jgi:hypothetical protein